MLLSWVALALDVKRNTKIFWRRAKQQDFPPITKEIEAIYEKHCAKTITILPAYDVRFPQALKQLPDCPPVLFIKGDVDVLSKPCIGIIGSRQGSLLARQWTRDAAEALSKAGWTIVSGLAKGIDGAAHQGALSTIGVVAGGVDYIYPLENKKLFETIPTRGCVISEEPLETKAQASFFPKRNRIIAGLSKALIVVEAASGSGSLITVKAALEYGRHIFVVPGPPWDTRYGASLKLLRDGAALCVTAQDLLEVLLPLTQEIVQDLSPKPLLLPRLSKNDLLSLLGPTPVPLHQLCMHYDSVQVMSLLTELELEDLVERIGDSICKR